MEEEVFVHLKDGEGGICLHFCLVAKIKDRTSVCTGAPDSPPDCRILFSNPILPIKKTTRLGGLFYWRRRRDLNPRYPFGVYTISNRAYDFPNS